MKKFALIFFFALVFAVNACVSPSVILPIDPELTDVVEITVSDLTQAKNAGEPFLLYISSVTCLSCAEFRPHLQTFIQSSGLTVRKIEADQAFPIDNAVFDYLYTPTLILFDGETIVFEINALDDPKPFSSVEELTKFLEKHIILE